MEGASVQRNDVVARRSRTVLAAILALTAALGCSPANPGDLGESLECYWDRQLEQPGGQPPSVTESQVYLDLSRTMSGFISEGEDGRPVTLQQELLRTILLEALGNVDVGPPTLWGFGREIFPLERSLSGYAAREGHGSVSPKTLYDQAETDVVGALLAASKQPSALSVILTDNAQDLRTSKETRAPGFDRSAMIRAITQDLAGNGFGAWLIGYHNSFRGTYFSILLAPNSEGIRINKPIPLNSDQPLYAWVVSKDLSKGRAVVDHLVVELRRRWRVRNPEGEAPVHAVELAPGVHPRVVPREPHPDELAVESTEEELDVADPQRDIPVVRSWNLEHGEPPRVGATLVYQRPRGVSLLFPLKVEIEQDRDNEWGRWPLAVWGLRWKTEAAEGPGATLAEDLEPFPILSSQATRFRKLIIPYDQLMAYKPDRRRIELPLAIAFQREEIPEEHWLATWSTDNDTTRDGVEGKTLYLSDVATAVLDRTVGPERPAACVHLTFVEE
jgi:hypothetical protein